MSRPPEFEWDVAKAASNAAKHGVAFPVAVRVFADPHCFVVDASRAADGESRHKAVGMIDGHLFTVVWTRRHETVRVISARRLNSGEERLYGDRSLQP